MPTTTYKLDQDARDAMEAHTNLNIFGAVAGLLESGVIYGEHARVAAAKIIKVCHAEEQWQLRVMDKKTGRKVHRG